MYCSTNESAKAEKGQMLAGFGHNRWHETRTKMERLH